jgi:hypothetical protein
MLLDDTKPTPGEMLTLSALLTYTERMLVWPDAMAAGKAEKLET